MAKFVLEFALEGETKGALKFKELDSEGNQVSTVADGKIGQLYMRKSAFPGGKFPDKLTVTVESFIIGPWKE